MESLILVCYIYCFLVGICVTSFMNVVIDRVPRHESFVAGRSHCDKCNHTLAWYDLIPIVSYLLLKGKCRYCGTKIPIRGFILEIVGGLLAMLCFNVYGFSAMTLLSFIVMMILLAISMIDIDTMEIPDGLNIALFIVSIVIGIVEGMNIVDGIIGMLCISVPMFMFILIIPNCFGGGDIKLMFACGFALGWVNSLVATFIGILLAGIYSIYLLASKKVTRKAHIAFGPYLSVGIAVAMLYGKELVSWYLNLLM